MAGETESESGPSVSGQTFTWMEERYRKVPAWASLAVMVCFAQPLLLVMSGMLLYVLAYGRWNSPGIGPRILAGVLGILILPLLCIANWLFLRIAMGLWKYGVRGAACLRADEEGIHGRNWVKGGFITLRWEEVGVVGILSGVGLCIQHRDPKGWMRRQPLWKRYCLWQFQRKYGIAPAIGCSKVQRNLADVQVDIVRLRDLKHAAAAPEQAGA